MKEYDAVVIGAGPSGASFAYYASKAGLNVLIVEKQREIGHTIQCAEGVSTNFLSLIGEPERAFIANYIYGGELLFENKIKVAMHAKTPTGAIIERRIFDRYLVEKAVAAGSNILINSTFQSYESNNNSVIVTVKNGGNSLKFKTPLLIGADGPASKVSKKASIYTDSINGSTYYAYQLYIYCPGIDSKHLYFAIGEHIAPLGYIWLFPKGNGFVNAGIGLPGQNALLENHLLKFLDEFCPRYKILGVLHGVIPTQYHKTKLFSDNVMILGDAAKLADPISGGGIANGYISGMVAAETAARAVQNGRFDRSHLASYQRKLNKWLLKDYMVSLTFMYFYRGLSQSEMEMVAKVIKDALNGKDITTLSPLHYIPQIIKEHPEFLWFLIKKGGNAVVRTLSEFI